MFLDYQIDPFDTIREMKDKIRDRTSIPVDEQFLVINDTEVHDHRTVSSYNIDDDSSVHLIRLNDAPNIPVHSTVGMQDVCGFKRTDLSSIDHSVVRLLRRLS
jgi:large subunit ribosomal protein L40e